MLLAKRETGSWNVKVSVTQVERLIGDPLTTTMCIPLPVARWKWLQKCYCTKNFHVITLVTSRLLPLPAVCMEDTLVCKYLPTTEQQWTFLWKGGVFYESYRRLQQSAIVENNFFPSDLWFPRIHRAVFGAVGLRPNSKATCMNNAECADVESDSQPTDSCCTYFTHPKNVTSEILDCLSNFESPWL